MTVMSVVPSDVIRSLTDACAPVPSATIAITAPTPMMMPSIVSIERSLTKDLRAREMAFVLLVFFMPVRQAWHPSLAKVLIFKIACRSFPS